MTIEHFYNEIPGWFNFRNLYDFALDTIPNNGTWVEIGSWQGKSISYAIVESIKRKKNINFIVVDIWKFNPKDDTKLKNDQDLFCAFLKNTKKIEDFYSIIKQDSSIASENFKNESIDVCMIDADHDYNAVLNDIIKWYPKIKKDGLLLGDDYTKKFPGVIRAVTEFSELNNINFKIYEKSWLIRKL